MPHSIYLLSSLICDGCLANLSLSSSCIERYWCNFLVNQGDEKTRQRFQALFPDQGLLEEWNLSLLHRAVLGLNPICLDTLLDHLPRSTNVNEVDSRGRTALFWAAKRGDFSATFSLLKSGADVNKSTPNEFSPLAAAIESRNQPCIRAILEYSPDTTNFSGQGHLPIHLSCYFGSEIDIVESLLDRGVNINAISALTRNTPLMFAAQESHLRIIEYLISRDANLNLINQDGETALLIATCHSCSEVIRLLLQNGADYITRSKAGENLLHYAAQFGDLACLKTLYAFDLAGINLHDRATTISPLQRMKDIKGLTALQIAEKRPDVTPEWRDMFRKLVHGIEYPESKLPIEVIGEIEEFQDADEQQTG